MNGGPQESTTTQTVPGWANSAAKSVWDRISSFLNGSQTAAQQGVAAFPFGQQNDFMNQAMSLLGGDILNPNFEMGPNKYVDAAYNSAASDITKQFRDATAPSVASMFISSGAPGGSAYNTAQDQASYGLATSLGNLSNQYQYQNYSQGRQNLLSGEQLVPGMVSSSAQYSPQNWPYLVNQMLGNALNIGFGTGGMSKTSGGGSGKGLF